MPFLFLFSTFWMQNPSPLLLLEVDQSVNLYEVVQYYLEPGHTTFSLDRLEKAPFYEEEDRIFHHLQGNTLWMKIQINKSTNTAQPYFFVVYNAYLPEGQLFLQNDLGLWKGHLHNYKQWQNEKVYFNNPTWRISLAPGKNTLYFKFFDTAERTRTLSFLMPSSAFKQWQVRSVAFLAFMVLSIVALIFVISLGSFYIKTPYFMFYALYLFGLLIDFLAYKGWGGAYLWPGQLFLVDNIRSLSNVVSSFAVCFFFYRFYEGHHTPRWTYKLFHLMGLYFGVLLLLYGIKTLFGGFSTLFVVVFKSIQLCALLIIVIHTFLGFKKYVPLYLPMIFILHTLCIVVQVTTNFPVTGRLFIDSFSVNMYYYTLLLELGVLTYYIIKHMWAIQQNISQMAVQLERLTKKLEAVTQNKPEMIKLKSKALVALDAIHYIKSDDKFLEFHTQQGREIERETLKNMQLKLPEGQFVQIHKSFIVNLLAVRAAYSNKVLLKSGDYLPVSRSHKDNLQKILATAH